MKEKGKKPNMIKIHATQHANRSENLGTLSFKKTIGRTLKR